MKDSLLVRLGFAVLLFTLFSPSTMFFGNNFLRSTPSPLHTSGHYILDASDNVVYLRGIGRAGDLDSLSGTWGGVGQDAFSYDEKWQTDFSALKLTMDQTLSCYRNVWKANMIRVLVPVDWWWIDQINPHQRYGAGPNQVMSYQNYIELLVKEAGKFGIYVDFCPYEVLNYYNSSDQWDGIPGTLGDASLAFMQSINPDEMQAWSQWWTSVVNRLGKYPNVIFELWNEPDDGTTTATSAEAQAFFNYAVEAYQTIRDAGNMNLIFMQWHAGLIPYKTELDWVPQMYNKLAASLGSAPQNVVFTTHPYRRAPFPNLEWATDYAGVAEQLNLTNMVPITRSNGLDVPLVFNEMGVMSDPSVYSNNYYPAAQQPESNLTTQTKMLNELLFFQAIMQAAKEQGIGVCAFYWMQPGVWFGSEVLVSGPWATDASGPVPTDAGYIFINAAS